MYRPSRLNHKSYSNKITSVLGQRHLSQRRTNGSSSTRSFKMALMYCILLVFVIGFVCFYYDLLNEDHNSDWDQHRTSVEKEKENEFHRLKDSNLNKRGFLKVTDSVKKVENDDSTQSNALQKNHFEKNRRQGDVSIVTSRGDPICSFRTYKPHRYYPIHDLQESFLADSEYIRGKLPFVLNQEAKSSPNRDTLNVTPHKLCIDTSSWEQVIPGHRPFSDGQNPSFISLDKPTMDPNTLSLIQQLYGKHVKDKFMGLLLFGDSQCRWNMTTEELEEYQFSPLQSAPSKRTMVLVLNHDLQPLGEAVLELELDADWGEKRKRYKRQQHDSDGLSFKRTIVEMDDARLFFHNDQLHVLYRNGPSYGYEKQIQNIIHVEPDGNHQFKAYIKASETFTVCCGRNIAFISELPRHSGTMNNPDTRTTSDDSKKNDLFALTWIDPVTTQVVNLPQEQTVSPMDVHTLLQAHSRRRLASSKKKSSIHGTNGYMIPLQSSSELLGIAHFHRPENRDTSGYARHGHHYTHAFFTIQASPRRENGSEIQFHLSRLSNEFVFSSPSSDSKDTADVIQFASGLDIFRSDNDTKGKVMISYGINDCEAAILFVGLDFVNELLLPVNDGDEVMNVMKKLDL